MCNDSNFLSYRLLQSFQSLETFVNFCFEVAPEKKIAGGQIWWKRRRCVVTSDLPFFINSSTIKALCSPDHAMVYTENGTYTAVRRRAPHHCTRSQPEAMPHPNRGVLSAAPCITDCFCHINTDMISLTCRPCVFEITAYNSSLHSLFFSVHFQVHMLCAQNFLVASTVPFPWL